MTICFHRWRTDYGTSRYGQWSHTHCHLCGLTLRYIYRFPR